MEVDSAAIVVGHRDHVRSGADGEVVFVEEVERQDLPARRHGALDGYSCMGG